MQCTSYIPVYYHARDLNIGASGFSWRPFESNANYGDERVYNISLPPRTLDPCLSYDQEMLRQIIQSQEATFRYQVQELHRLYRRQRELMDEMRVTQIFTQHFLPQTSGSISCLPQPPSNISQTTSNATSWLLGDRSHSKLSELTAENFLEHTTVCHDPSVRKSGYNEVKFLSSRSNGNENRIFDLELPANTYHYDEVKQLGNLSEAPGSTIKTEFCPVKTEDLSSFDSNSRKTNSFIDLNEPIHLESLPESVAHTHSGLPSCSDGINYSLAIDLNSSPVSSFSDTENLENGKFLKSETCIDLNTGLVVDDKSSPQISRSIIPTKSTGDMDLEGPVSPENEECSPPRGKSEDIRLEEPILEDDIIAAKNLVMLASQGVEKYVKNSLFWLAEIVSSAGGNLENEVMKLQNDARIKKETERAFLSRAGKGRARGTRQRTEATKHLQTTEGFPQTCTSKRNAGKKICPKRRCTRLSPSGMFKKSTMSSILKQGWGKVKKREGGHRRRASKFLVIS